MSELRLHFLGPPRIERRGAPVNLDTRKAVALLAYLATASPNGRNTRDALAVLLYPDYSQERARASFRRTLSALRAGVGSQFVTSDREMAALNLDAGVWCDVLRFQELLDQRRRHGHAASDVCAACLPLLEKAAACHHGDFMAGFTLRDSVAFDDWQALQAERLRRELSTTLDRLVHGWGAQREWQAAIAAGHRWVAIDPLHEPAYRRLMQLYTWSGQRAAALRQYRDCVRALDEELGVSPLPETTALYQAILEGEAGEGWRLAQPDTATLATRPAAAPPAEPAPRADRAARAGPDRLPLVGRNSALAALSDAYRAAAAGQFALVEGEAGIGKTRLAEEFACQAAQHGASVVVARCYEGDARQAYGPLVDALRAALAAPALADRLAGLPALWLGEVSRLTPEMAAMQPGLPVSPQLDETGAQARFFEGIAQAFLALLADEPPGILFLDELQWADEATLSLLAYLVRRLRGKPWMLLATLRSEPSAAAGAVRRLLAEQQRAGHGVSITLDRLSLDEVRALIAAAGLVDVPATTVQRLHRETEGLPLFVVEYLAAMQSGKLPAASDAWELPAGLRLVLQARLNEVDEVGRQLLAAAAVIGRSFPFGWLRAVSGRSEEEAVVGLEAIAAAGLVRELRDGAAQDGEPRYDFGHEQMRRVIYEDVSLARRRLLHRRAADALIHSTGGRDAPAASQIALHLRRGGSEAEAATYYRLAGAHARSVFANNEALSHYDAALALGYPDASELHEAIGDLLTLQGAYPRAVMSFETAAALASDPQRMAHLEHKLGLVHLRQGRWELADSRFAAAVAAGTAGDVAWRASLYADWSQGAHRQGDAERALGLAQAALQLALSSSDDRAAARAHNAAGVLARSRRDLPAALGHLHGSLAAARRMDDLPAQIAALNNMALTAHDCDDDEQSLALFAEALALCVRIGDLHRQAALLNNLADLLHASGRQDEAMDYLKQAVAIFASIGAPPAQPDDWQPEIWKLVEW